MSEKKAKLYVELVVSGCFTLLGIECAGFSIWYFIEQSGSPYQVLKDVPILAILLAVSLIILSLAIAYLTMRVLVKKSAMHGNSLPQASSFIEFLKVSRIWVLVPLIVIVIPLAFMKAKTSALKIAPEGIARTVFDVAMVFLIAFGFMLAIVGLGKVISTFTKLHGMRNVE